MERLTARDEQGFAHYPHCFEKCNGDAVGIKCQTCDFDDKICNKLAEYEDLEEQGLLLKLPCKKDELINVLAKRLLSTEFGNCYMCINPMKNITLDGINNGCDGMCNASDSATVDDFLKKIIREIEAQAALEKMKAGGVDG